MDQQPDYSKYSEQELRQVRKHIDADRYPERVAEIEARLTALAAVPRDTTSVDEDLSPVTSARLWRRAVAFVLDFALLGIVGAIAGACLYEPLTVLGPWGRVLGFAIATAYFGVSQSHVGDGQSLGMKVLGLRVVTASGTPLSVGASLLRAGIFCLSYFLGSLPSAFSGLNAWVASALSMLIFGVGACSTYLLIFNRKTRQTLHDLAVGAFVVNDARGPLALPTERVWRGHAAIVTAALVAFCVAGVWMALPGSLGDMLRVRQAVMSLPGVSNASVMLNYGPQNARTLSVTAVTDASAQNPEALARRVAKAALENYANVDQMKTVTVTLSSGFDIGIAQVWRSVNYVRTPREWRAR
ncbi:putative RDD family membrane protein YckC [Duganella sp. 1224]|uniref:RDD family protein n=1 Tax=Duganella sp. 1224 TaxID=2587052 RepID=UPI0015CDDB40|nr:RDD family protein [Duganella sp. 1224]NYE63125.1 putative RDD family membrane protein YckC [Duganella sp. 1224]